MFILSILFFAVTVGLLMLSETIFAPIWVWLFLNEIPPSSVFIGGLIIIFAITYVINIFFIKSPVHDI